MGKIDFKTLGQGNFTKTGPRSGKFQGPKHGGGGIKTVGPDGNMIEVEGGESVGEVNTNAGKQPYIYSEYVKRYGGVSYADEFDKMVKNGAPQKELDMLAAEQDSKAKNTGGPVQVTPMRRGGVVKKHGLGGTLLDIATGNISEGFTGHSLSEFVGDGRKSEFAKGQSFMHNAAPNAIKRAWPASKPFVTAAQGIEGMAREGEFFGFSHKDWGGLQNSNFIQNNLVGHPDNDYWAATGHLGSDPEWGERDPNWDVSNYQKGGFTNNTNNNNMANRNRLSRRVMQYDSRYRNGGIQNYPTAQMGGFAANYGPQIYPMQGAIDPRQTGLQYQNGGIPQYGWGGNLLRGAFGLSGLLGGAALGRGSLKGRGVPPHAGRWTGSQEEWDMRQESQRRGLAGYSTAPQTAGISGVQLGGSDLLSGPDNYSQTDINKAAQGGLANRVMQYQGDEGSNILQDTSRTLEPMEESIGFQGDKLSYMTSLIKTGSGGFETLPSEAQNKVIEDFKNMTPEEQDQWIKFMTEGPEVDEEGNPVFQKKSPTRTDSTEKVSQQLLKQISPVVE